MSFKKQNQVSRDENVNMSGLVTSEVPLPFYDATELKKEDRCLQDLIKIP
jgi:hypothetical protein